MAHNWESQGNSSPCHQLPPQPLAGGRSRRHPLCVESIPAWGRAFPAGDRRRKEPHVPWQEAVSSAGGDGTVAGEMPAARGRQIKIKERRAWKGPGSSQHKHKPHCRLVSHPRGSSDSRQHSQRPGNWDGISPGSTSQVRAWGSPLAPDGRGKLRHGAGGGKGLPRSA